MPDKPIHQCQCSPCQQSISHPDQQWHQNLNVLMSRLDEQQRRWYAAVEANRLGHGGEHLMALITGLDEKTIRRGLSELAQQLQTRPTQQVRLAGGGRPTAEKKSLS
jgi:hypothetical protein